MNEETQSPPTPGIDPVVPKEYESKKELAQRLGVSIRTIDNLLVRGLPHMKLTRKLTRFPRIPVDQWLSERQVRRA